VCRFLFIPHPPNIYQCKRKFRRAERAIAGGVKAARALNKSARGGGWRWFAFWLSSTLKHTSSNFLLRSEWERANSSFTCPIARYLSGRGVERLRKGINFCARAEVRAGHATFLAAWNRSLLAATSSFCSSGGLLYIRSRLKKQLIAGFIAPADKVKNAPLTQK
jgi:hypothetical protein